MSHAPFISADSHVVEVPATWERVQAQYGDRAPRVVWSLSELEPGPYLVLEGMGVELLGPSHLSCATQCLALAGEDIDPGSFRRSFRFEDYPGPWDPHQRVQDMDRDGIAAEVLYASQLRLFYEASLGDEPLFRAVASSYNEWLLDFCSYYPHRLIGLPVLSVLNAEGAAEDLRAYARRGARGFMIASAVPLGQVYSDPRFDVLWRAAVECDTPLHLHVLTGRWKLPAYHYSLARMFIGDQAQIQTSLAEMIYGGVFDRFPNLKIVSAEYDIGWVAHTAHRGGVFQPRLDLELAPGDYLKRNVWFTFQNDPAGVQTAQAFDASRFLWASDYPHAASTWPRSNEVVEAQFAGTDIDLRRRLTRENTAAFYGLDI